MAYPELDFLPLIAVYRIKLWCLRNCETEHPSEALIGEIKALKTEIAKRVFVMRKFRKQKVPRYDATANYSIGIVGSQSPSQEVASASQAGSGPPL